MWIHNCKYTQVRTKCIVWVCKSRITHTEIQEVHISGLFWFIALRCPYSSALTDQEMVILQNCWSNLWWIHDPRTAVPPHSGKWKKKLFECLLTLTWDGFGLKYQCFNSLRVDACMPVCMHVWTKEWRHIDPLWMAVNAICHIVMKVRRGRGWSKGVRGMKDA